VRQVTIVLAYYLNAGMLQRQYEELRALPEPLREQLALIVVDDGSPVPAIGAEIGMPLKIFRMRKDVRWNQDACRNIGVHHAETRWVLLTDMDHLAPLATLQSLVYGSFDQAAVYKFARVSAPDLAPYKPHPNSWFMTRKMFDRIGGYDERFAGYYGTDADFRDRVKKIARIEQLDDVLIRVPREVIPDASTTTYGRKEKQDAVGIKRVMHERDRVRGWKPLRLTFPYDCVWEQPVKGGAF
jgi:hypothetical protein